MFKARMIYYASFERWGRDSQGNWRMLHWHELAKEKWTQVYRTTGTPCSCWLCQGIRYDRLKYKRDTRRIIDESFD